MSPLCISTGVLKNIENILCKYFFCISNGDFLKYFWNVMFPGTSFALFLEMSQKDPIWNAKEMFQKYYKAMFFQYFKNLHACRVMFADLLVGKLKGWSTATVQLVETTTDYKHRQRPWTGNGTWLVFHLTFCCTWQIQVPLSTTPC